MTKINSSPQHHARNGTWYWFAFCAFLAIAAFFLWSEHRAHALGVLPYLLLLACPLIHIFGHRGHRGPGGHHE